MERRDFIALGVTGLGASIIAPVTAVAASDKQSMAGGVFYTKENPGRWSKKIAGHLPNIDVDKSNGKVSVQVVTAHGMDSYQHYIVKHVLLDEDFNFLAEKMFDPATDKAPLSSFELENYKGTLYALSMCNKHDVWLNSVKI